MQRSGLLLLGLALTFGPTLAQDQPMMGRQAPDFSLISTTGEEVTLSKLKGEAVVIHFAASW